MSELRKAIIAGMAQLANSIESTNLYYTSEGKIPLPCEIEDLCAEIVKAYRDPHYHLRNLTDRLEDFLGKESKS